MSGSGIEGACNKLIRAEGGWRCVKLSDHGGDCDNPLMPKRRKPTLPPIDAHGLEHGALYRHRRTGGLYRIDGIGRLQIEDGKHDLRAVVIYRAVTRSPGDLLGTIDTGHPWVRPCEEFAERFVKVHP